MDIYLLCNKWTGHFIASIVKAETSNVKDTPDTPIIEEELQSQRLPLLQLSVVQLHAVVSS